MPHTRWQWSLVLAIGLAALGLGEPGLGRPVADDTLGAEGSRVVDFSPVDFDVEGGARRGRNLFHSFSEFNVDEGASVYFIDPGQVENILTRVTGNNPSVINGVLGTIGVENGVVVRSTANLFLMNPNGILFGENASLDVKGSFVGTTANAIGFGEQGFFSASSPGVPSALLTVAPSAFLFSQVNAAPIQTSIAPSGIGTATK